jgi:hypothetical protein
MLVLAFLDISTSTIIVDGEKTLNYGHQGSFKSNQHRSQPKQKFKQRPCAADPVTSTKVHV